ncbi:family 10 glycosylhydrolase [bacterium]|nr:family 10 glycosylhydrolase [bacterium]
MLCLSANSTSADEFRGGWVTAWNKGLFTPSEADATIAAAKKAGLNTLFVQVRKVGDAYYDSSIEPRGENIAPGFDPLAYMVEKGHANGIRIHAWVNVCRVWREKTLPTDPSHIVNRHPDWLNKEYDGNMHADDGMFMDPGVPDAREYTADLIADIAKRYDLDGIHLDYIRYSGTAWGYSDIALARYKAENGTQCRPKPDDPKWLRWRMDQVTELVSVIRSRVHAVKPNLTITAATIAWGDCMPTFTDNAACKRTCQNWCNWLNGGLIDAAVPMNYRRENKADMAAQFRLWLKGFAKWGNGRPTYVGVDLHNNSTSNILRQIAAVRKAGLQGYVLFSFNDFPVRDAIVAALAKQSGVSSNEECSTSAGFFDKGIRCAEANQLGMAKVYLKKSIEMDQNNAEAHFRLGRVYLREKNYTMAKQEFDTTLTLDPSHEGAKVELESIAL